MLREDELADGDLLGSGSAGVHGADPFEPVAGLQDLGHALGPGELREGRFNKKLLHGEVKEERKTAPSVMDRSV